MAIDWNKPIRTKSKNRARLVTDRSNSPFFYGVLVEVNGREAYFNYKEDGRYPHNERMNAIDLDLENVPDMHFMYLNIYEKSCETREEADRYAHEGRIACVRVPYQEGQYDD